MYIARRIKNCPVTDVLGDGFVTGQKTEDGSDVVVTISWLIREVIRAVPAKDHLEDFITYCVDIGQALQKPGDIVIRKESAEWLEKAVVDLGVFPHARVVEAFKRHLCAPEYAQDEAVTE